MKNKEHETFELAEDVFARWKKENTKWYNKYFVIPFHTFIYTIKNFPSEVKWFYQRGSRGWSDSCLLYTSPSPRDGLLSRMPSSA